MNVGDIVDLNTSFMDEPVGTLAFVYDTYADFDGRGRGVCIITQNGVDIGGFSVEDQFNFLTFRKHSGVEYQFTNVIQLGRDFMDGKFKGAFV